MILPGYEYNIIHNGTYSLNILIGRTGFIIFLSNTYQCIIARWLCVDNIPNILDTWCAVLWIAGCITTTD